MTPAPGDVSDAADRWGAPHGAGGAPAHPHAGGPTDEAASRLAPRHPRRPPAREAKGAGACRAPSGAPRPGRPQAGPGRGDEAAWARPMVAASLPHAQRPRAPVAPPRESGQRPGIMTVDRRRRHITGRASGLRRGGRPDAGAWGRRVIETAGVTWAREGVRQQRGTRVSPLRRRLQRPCVSVVLQEATPQRPQERGGHRRHQPWPRAINRPHPWSSSADTPPCRLVAARRGWVPSPWVGVPGVADVLLSLCLYPLRWFSLLRIGVPL
jgi:hypothetical protein